MSYKCTLSFLNKIQRKQAIINMYNTARESESIYCYYVVLMWMFEFICSYYFINTDEEVSLKAVLKNANFHKGSLTLLNVWSEIRNQIAHCVFPIKRSEIIRLSRCYIDEVFENFEEDKSVFIELFLNSCNSIITESEDFNKSIYLHKHIKVLPEASALACETKEDCDALLYRLGLSK